MLPFPPFVKGEGVHKTKKGTTARRSRRAPPDYHSPLTTPTPLFHHNTYTRFYGIIVAEINDDQGSRHERVWRLDPVFLDLPLNLLSLSVDFVLSRLTHQGSLTDERFVAPRGLAWPGICKTPKDNHGWQLRDMA